MAFDEALLERCAADGRPVLRFYAWTEPAATFGYFQQLAEISRLTPLRPLVRRPTGGGLVPHDRDWTYSVAVPPGHAWHELRAAESYRQMHAWLRDGFTELGLATTLAPRSDPTGPGQCFGGGWAASDLLSGGRKLAGAAQRRNRLGLLIQGSIQPVPPAFARGVWQNAMRTVAERQGGVVWSHLVPDPALRARVATLAEEKYSQPGYHARR